MVGSALVGWLLTGLSATAVAKRMHASAALKGSGAGGLANLIQDLGAARAVGDRYRALRPNEADQEWLVAAIFDCDVPVDRRVARRRFLSRRQKDFETGDVVILDGWILARAEARLCLLAALS